MIVTGFEVYLTARTDASPERTDPGFVGTIALFRHDGLSSTSNDVMEGMGHKMQREASDTFNVTAALAASGQADPSKLYMLIKPFSLVQVRQTNAELVDTGTLHFDSIEFFTQT